MINCTLKRDRSIFRNLKRYKTVFYRIMVPIRGFEPLTYALRMRRSTN